MVRQHGRVNHARENIKHVGRFSKWSHEASDAEFGMHSPRCLDGSIDIVLDPTPPHDLEKNWIPTSPGKSWFACFGLFGPLESHFGRSWSLPDIPIQSG